MNLTIKKKFFEYISSRISDISETITAGHLEPKDYGLHCGRVQGLHESLRVFEEIWEDYRKKMQSTEEEFE